MVIAPCAVQLSVSEKTPIIFYGEKCPMLNTKDEINIYRVTTNQPTIGDFDVCAPSPFSAAISVLIEKGNGSAVKHVTSWGNNEKALLRATYANTRTIEATAVLVPYPSYGS